MAGEASLNVIAALIACCCRHRPSCIAISLIISISIAARLLELAGHDTNGSGQNKRGPLLATLTSPGSYAEGKMVAALAADLMASSRGGRRLGGVPTLSSRRRYHDAGKRNRARSSDSRLGKRLTKRGKRRNGAKGPISLALGEPSTISSSWRVAEAWRMRELE